MNIRLNIRPIRQEPLLGKIAILLLLLILIDVGSMSTCCKNLKQPTFQSSLVKAVTNEISGSSEVTCDNSQITYYCQDQPSESSSCEEECFCCATSTHAVILVSLQHADVWSLHFIQHREQLPSPHVKTAFHPPRLT
jgi:hypothetical protein